VELHQVARAFLLDWFGRFLVFTAVSWAGLQTALIARPPAKKALLCAASAAAIYVVIASPIIRFVAGQTIEAAGVAMVGLLVGLLVWGGSLVLQVVMYWLIFSFCLDACVNVRFEDEAGVTARSVIPAMVIWLGVRIAIGLMFPEFVMGPEATAAGACYG
jgi:hypothetical protein